MKFINQRGWRTPANFDFERNKTGDGQLISNVKTLYRVNKFTDVIETFEPKDIRFLKNGNLVKTNKEEFDMFHIDDWAINFFASESMAQAELKRHLELDIAHHTEQARYSTAIVNATKIKLERLEQAMSPYLKATKDKPAERVGKVRI